MTNHSALRVVRIAIVSMVFALAALSFLTGGIASAQTVNSASAAQSGILQGLNPPTVQVVVNTQGLAAYSPNQIIVSSRQAFTIVNSTKTAQTIVGAGSESFILAPGGSIPMSFSQTGQFQITLLSTHATLTVNVVPFRG